MTGLVPKVHLCEEPNHAPDAFIAVEQEGRARIIRYLLCWLRPEEVDLDAGRFSRYCHDIKPFPFTVSRRIGSRDDLQAWFNRMFEWVSADGTGLWTFRVSFDHMNSVNAEFSFDNDLTMVVFALKFA